MIVRLNKKAYKKLMQVADYDNMTPSEVILYYLEDQGEDCGDDDT